MKCPDCKVWATVLETRDRQDGTTYRRYECANHHRFSTDESPTPAKQPRHTQSDFNTSKRSIYAAPQPF
jgi:transcriptional regulator NrdR family protein